VRFTVDTNILFYAVDRQSPDKREVAQDILKRGQHLDMMLASQVLGEFLNAVRRKNADAMEEAIDLVAAWSSLFPIGWTGPDHIHGGARRAVRHKLQFWDSVILEVARDGRAMTILTEDLQDGAVIDGITILNPFNPENCRALDILLEK
jgi:predicted nucleic acid-binding protein